MKMVVVVIAGTRGVEHGIPKRDLLKRLRGRNIDGWP